MNLLDAMPRPVRRLADAIVAAGGIPILVGGAVRDYLLGLTPKDIDIEVFGLAIGPLSESLARVAKVHLVGKSFGVLKARIGEMEVDVSLPRRERKSGQGHRGFEVDHDPSMSFSEAASRRDFTINAIGVDLRSGGIIDPWGGVSDLKACMIRHVSDAFDEDPLRVLRACQFSARFGFAIAPETLEKCRSLQGELATLSVERIWEELKKLLLKSPVPSVGMRALETTGALSLFPEISALRGARHNPNVHPEGDVWEHNNRVLDACALICRQAGLDEKESLILMLAALCHDLGKPLTARLVDGVWRNPDYERAGEEPARSLLVRMGCPPSLVDGIATLVREHGQPYRLWKQNLTEPVADGAIRRLALQAPIVPLCRLALADFRGRELEEAKGACPAVEWLLQRADELSLKHQVPKPILLGRNLQALGVKPGPGMGELLKAAFEDQLDGEFNDLAGALGWVQARLPGHSIPRQDTPS